MHIVLELDINELQLDSIKRLIAYMPWSHHADIIVRKDGQDKHFEADWLKGARLRDSKSDTN